MDRRLVGLLLLVFCSLLPWAGTYLLHYPDERHYTDAALWMVEKHDWLTPLSAQGEPRLIKPIVPYWAVALPYVVAGVSALTSRLVFLLAGVGTIALTWRLALQVTHDRTVAWIAALILASHAQWLLTSVRSMPDALLTLFLTLSVLGFTRALWNARPTATERLLAWGGAGLAVAAKGLLPVVFVVYVVVFAFGRGWRRHDSSWRRRLLDPWAIAVGLLIGLSWYAAMWGLHGAAFWQAFTTDQVTNKVGRAWYDPVYFVPLFALILGVNFLPWSLIALDGWRRGRRPAAPRDQDHAALFTDGQTPPATQWVYFACGWAALGCIIFGLGGNASLRYLLPVTPPMAVVLAIGLRRWAVETRGALALWTWVLALGLALAGVGLALVNWELGHGVSGAIVLLMGAGLAYVMVREQWRGTWSMESLIGCALVLSFPLAFLGLNRIFLPDTAGTLLTALEANAEYHRDRPLVLIGAPEVAAKMRVLSHGTLRLGNLDKPRGALVSGVTYLLDRRYVLFVDTQRFAVGHIRAGYTKLQAGGLCRALATWSLADYLHEHEQFFILAVPLPGTSPPSAAAGR